MTASGPLTLGTAGHIDHGKTALVRALTGVDTDRLPEERERGISIALGYAPLTLPSGRRLSLIDVPGHERFVRTMVAGASGIDLYLMVVAADDGVMPQTRRACRRSARARRGRWRRGDHQGRPRRPRPRRAGGAGAVAGRGRGRRHARRRRVTVLPRSPQRSTPWRRTCRPAPSSREGHCCTSTARSRWRNRHGRHRNAVVGDAARR